MADQDDELDQEKQDAATGTNLENPVENQEDTANVETKTETGEHEEKTEATRERGDVKREILEKQVLGADPDTGKEILSIDIEKNALEQMKQLDTLETVGMTLFAKIFDSGVLQSKISKFSDLITLDQDHQLKQKFEKNLNPTEKIAFAKLLEIAKNPTCGLYSYFERKWVMLIPEYQLNYKNSQKVKDVLLGKDSDSGLYDWIKHNPKTTGLMLLAGAAGAYGIYRLFKRKKKKEESADDKKDDNKDKEEKKDGWFMKSLKFLGTIASIYTVGALIGVDNIKKWCKKLREFSKNPDGLTADHQKIAEAITKDMQKEVSAKTIKSVSAVKYTEFMSLSTQIGEAAGGLIGDTVKSKLLPDSWVKSKTYKFIFGDDEKQAKEVQAIREYLLKRETDVKDLGLPETATVMEVLNKLNNVPYTGQTDTTSAAPAAGAGAGAAGVAGAASAEKAETSDEDPEIDKGIEEAVEITTDKFVGTYDGAVNHIKESFKDSPHLQKFLKKYNGRLSDGAINKEQFVVELLSACKADGRPIAAGLGKVMICDIYGNFIVLTSWNAISKTLVEMAKAPFSEDIDMGDAVTEYMINATPFVVIGGGYGFLSGKGLKGRLWSAAKSGGRGALFPVKVGEFHIRAGQRIYRTKKGVEFKLRRYISKGPAATAILANEAEYFAKLATHYDNLLDPAKAKGAKGRWYSKLRKRISSTEYLEKNRIRYVNKFAEAYNQMNEALPNNGGKQRFGTDGIKTGDMTRLDNTVIEAQSFIDKREAARSSTPAPKAKTTGFKELDIATKASEVEINRILAGEKKPPNTDTAATEKWDADNRAKAIELMTEEFYTPKNVAGKTDTYKFMGEEIKISNTKVNTKIAELSKTTGKPLTDPTLKTQAIESLCREHMLGKIMITSKRTVVDGGKKFTEYKVGNEWVRAEIDPYDPSTKAKFMEALKKEGVTDFNFESFAKQSKVLKYFNVLQKIAGPTVAALVIYNLETAPASEKNKVVAETAAGFGTFFAGMKLTDWKIGSRITPNTPWKIAARGVIGLMGGIAAAYGLTEPIGDIVYNFYKDIPAAYGVSGQIISIFEKSTTKSITHMALRSAEKGVINTGLNKAGLHSVEKFLTQKVEKKFLQKIAKLGAKKGLKRLLIAAGPKAAVAAGLWADDATVIGVIDDVLAIPLSLWAAKDLYDIIVLTRDALKIKEEMNKRTGKPLASFRVMDRPSQAKVQEALQKNGLGLSLDNLQQLGETELFALLSSLPNTTIEIKRQGIVGKEIWTLQSGEAVGIQIFDNAGKMIAQIKDEDAKKIDKALQGLDQADAQEASDKAA